MVQHNITKQQRSSSIMRATDSSSGTLRTRHIILHDEQLQYLPYCSYMQQPIVGRARGYVGAKDSVAIVRTHWYSKEKNALAKFRDPSRDPN